MADTSSQAEKRRTGHVREAPQGAPDVALGPHNMPQGECWACHKPLKHKVVAQFVVVDDEHYIDPIPMYCAECAPGVGR